MKVSTEIDNNFGYEKITQLVDNIPLNYLYYVQIQYPSKFIIIMITYRSNKFNQNNRSLIDQTPERV